MKIRGLLIATVIFAVLAGVLYWSNHRKPSDETAKASSDAAPAILKLDEASITRLEVKKPDAPPLKLEKGSSGNWQITAPKSFSADESAVSGVLSTLSSLNSERLLDNNATGLKSYGLDQPALELDITEKDNKTQKLLIGAETPIGGAVYAMLAGDPRLFTVASYTKNSLDKTVNDLRDKRLLTISPVKLSRVEIVRKNEDLEFGRNQDEWQILKPRPLRADTFQVSELVRKLTDARMDLSVTDADNKSAAEAFARATPLAVAKVTDESGTQQLQVREEKGRENKGSKSPDTYYARSSVVDGVYKINSDLGQALDKGLEDYRNKKLFDFGFNDPDKIELHNGAKAYFLMRSGNSGDEAWWSNGKKMDTETVESLIDKLRDLSADKLLDSGFTSSAVAVSVTSNGGKHNEHVAFAKLLDHYVGKRDGDSTQYQVTSTSIDDLLNAADALKPAAKSGK